MTKNDFIDSLDFEVAKTTIAKKLGLNPSDIEIRPFKSGNFRINLKGSSGKVNSLFSGAQKAILTTDKLNIKESKDNFSYEANIRLNLKNNTGEYDSKVGKIDVQNNKFTFYTVSDLKTKREQVKAAKEAKTSKVSKTTKTPKVTATTAKTTKSKRSTSTKKTSTPATTVETA